MLWYPLPEGGVLRRAALLETGVDPADLDKAVRRKVVVPLQRGVYGSGEHVPNALERARAAVLAVGGCEAVASHRTAGRVHGLEVQRGGPDVVTIPRPERRPHRSGLEYHTTRLAPEDVTVVGGVPVTTVSRTLVDLVRTLPTVRAVWTVERALDLDRVDRAALETALARCTRAPGIREARRRIRAAEPASESPLETAARLDIIGAGLPVPELQMELVRADGRVARLDLAWREARVGLELDGRSEHGMELAVFEDRDRENQVVLRQFTIYRFTWNDVFRRRDAFLATVRAAIGA